MFRCRNKPPSFGLVSIPREIPEKRRPSTFLFTVPNATDPEGGIVSYYVYNNPLFIIPDKSVPLVYQSPTYSFNNRQNGDKYIVILVEARDDNYPPLSGWLFVQVTISPTTAYGPTRGHCYLGTACPFQFRGAGGHWPWTPSFFLDLYAVNASTQATAHVYGIAVLTRAAEVPASYQVAGDESIVAVEDVATGVVTYQWTPPVTLTPGLYSVLVRSPLGDVDVYSSWDYSAPFSIGYPYAYVASGYGDCVFLGASDCGNGFLYRDVSCMNFTNVVKSPTGAWVQAPVPVPDAYCRRFHSVRPGTQSYCFKPCIFSTAMVSPWSLCPSNCAPATRQRLAACVAPTGTIVPASQCTQPIPAAVETCPTQCSHFNSSSLWSECSSACGTGFQHSSAFCLSRTGMQYTNHTVCHSPGSRFITQECSTNTSAACAVYDLRVSPWTPCSDTCSRGGVPPVSTRVVLCIDTRTNQQVALASCAGAGMRIPPSSRACNSEPCQIYHYVVGPWSVCPVSCGVGTVTRELFCADSAQRLVDVSHCKNLSLSEPPLNQTCYVRGPCRCSVDRDCPFSNVHCADVACECTFGYSGDGCQIGIPQNAPVCGARSEGIYDNRAVCCLGLLNQNGTCCSHPGMDTVLDRNGECCLGKVDACGICNGTATTRDIQGRCCNGTLSASGLCCPHDECGVCHGNNECGFSGQISGVLNVDAALSILPSSLYAIQNDIRERIASVLNLPSSVVIITALVRDPRYVGVLKKQTPISVNYSIASPRMTAGLISGLLWEERQVFLASPRFDLYNQVSYERYGSACFRLSGDVSWSPQPNRYSVTLACYCVLLLACADCGNGLCEMGETCLDDDCTGGGCPVDCPLVFYGCGGDANVDVPRCSGHGLCNPSNNLCECFHGYEGDNCELCVPGFTQLKGSGTCLPLSFLDFAPSTTASASPSHSPLVRPATPDTTIQSAMTAVAAGVLIIGICVAGTVYYKLRRRQPVIDVSGKYMTPSSALASRPPTPGVRSEQLMHIDSEAQLVVGNGDSYDMDALVSPGGIDVALRQRLRLDLAGAGLKSPEASPSNKNKHMMGTSRSGWTNDTEDDAALQTPGAEALGRTPVPSRKLSEVAALLLAGRPTPPSVRKLSRASLRIDRPGSTSLQDRVKSPLSRVSSRRGTAALRGPALRKLLSKKSMGAMSAGSSNNLLEEAGLTPQTPSAASPSPRDGSQESKAPPADVMSPSAVVFGGSSGYEFNLDDAPADEPMMLDDSPVLSRLQTAGPPRTRMATEASRVSDFHVTPVIDGGAQVWTLPRVESHDDQATLNPEDAASFDPTPSLFVGDAHVLVATAIMDNAADPASNIIGLSVGDAVTVLAADGEWLYGEAGGVTGYFPAYCVSS